MMCMQNIALGHRLRTGKKKIKHPQCSNNHPGKEIRADHLISIFHSRKYQKEKLLPC
jgi:hypothetical protein